MNGKLKLILPVPPSVNHYLYHYCTRSTREDRHEVRAKLTDVAYGYKDTVGWEARQAGADLDHVTGGPVRVTVHVYDAIKGQRPTDIDNIGKTLMDGMEGIVFQNDSQVDELHIYRHKGAKVAHIEVEIEEIVTEIKE